MSPFTGPEPPSGITITDIGSDTAVVSWNASQSIVCEDAIRNYSVRYQLKNDGAGDYTTVYTYNTSVTLQGLNPNTVYNVSVASVSSGGYISVFSDTIQYKTSSGELKAI